MTTPDAPTRAALGGAVVRPPFLAYLDFLGDPVRATTWATSLTFAATGDADLDGHVFTAISPKLGSVSSVKRQTGGSDTVTATLSGIAGPDDELLDLLEDEANWKGRLARLWYLLKNADGTNVGGIVPFYTGRMVDLRIRGSAAAQTIEVAIETYLAALAGARNRTYLDQADFDPTDTSAALTLAVANGAKAG